MQAPNSYLEFNNYLACSRKYSKGKIVPEMIFHSHFFKPGHNAFTECEFTLIDQSSYLRSLRKREIFWQEKLNTFLPNGLNEREVPLEV